MNSTLTEPIKQMRVHIAEVHELFLGKEKVRVSEVIDALHEAIVNDYDGSSFPDYKNRWNFTVAEYFKTNQIELIKNPKPNWEPICADIIENLVANAYDFQGRQERRASTATTSTSATSTTNDMSSEAVPVKQVKLAEIDKDRIKNMYASMDKSKMWKLSTGKLVEEQMQNLALSKDHEHLAHSLVLNVQDHCWQEYFTDSELDEIKNYKAVELPALPSDIQVLLDDLKTTAKSNLYNKVTQEIHASTSDEKWVQDTYNTCFRLIQSGFFPLSSDITEQAIGKRMWSCLDACFDFSNIRCITGEKCSKASADAANSSRSASDSSRQQSGRKMDYIFKTRDAGYEIGCGECGLVGGVNTTKELQDAGYKMPKVMKDMLYRMAVKFPNVKHKLSICGFYIGENMLKLFILDCPVGNVCRYDGFIAVEYPLQESEVRKELSAVLTMIMSGRIIMEEAKKTLDDDESDVVLGRSKPVVMEPSFIPTGINYKKRKRHQM